MNNFDYINQFDQLYLFESGEIVEQGTPKKLMETETGILYQKCKETDRKLFNFIQKSLGIECVKGGMIALIKKSREKDSRRDVDLEKILRAAFEYYDANGSGQ